MSKREAQPEESGFSSALEQLRLLQELEFALAEQQVTGGVGSEDLARSIEELEAELPRRISSLYRSLKSRSRLVVIPEIGGRCSACSMLAPSSQLAAIRSESSVQQCQSCGRILYHADRPRPPAVSGAPKLGGPPIGRFSAIELMRPSLEATDRDGAIAELVDLLVESGRADDREELIRSITSREAVASTALDNGIAIPHAHDARCSGLTLAVGLSPAGLRFDPSSAKMTSVVFLFAVPATARDLYLRLLAGLVKSFRDVENRESLLACGSAREMWKVLRKVSLDDAAALKASASALRGGKGEGR